MTPRPLLVTSIRDILQKTTKPERALETASLVERYYDHVLVHGDPSIAVLGDTFDAHDRIADKTLYTGIVTPAPGVVAPIIDAHDVIVSVGGGAAGRSVLLAAAGAKRQSVLDTKSWLFLTGVGDDDGLGAEILRLAGPGAEVRGFVTGLDQRMRKAELSISRAGYNTVSDLLVAHCRSIIVPFAEGAETEQVQRADILSRKGLVTAILQDDLTVDALAVAIDALMAAPPPPALDINVEGAATTARIVSAIFANEPLDQFREGL